MHINFNDLNKLLSLLIELPNHIVYMNIKYGGVILNSNDQKAIKDETIEIAKIEEIENKQSNKTFVGISKIYTAEDKKLLRKKYNLFLQKHCLQGVRFFSWNDWVNELPKMINKELAEESTLKWTDVMTIWVLFDEAINSFSLLIKQNHAENNKLYAAYYFLDICLRQNNFFKNIKKGIKELKFSKYVETNFFYITADSIDISSFPSDFQFELFTRNVIILLIEEIAKHNCIYPMNYVCNLMVVDILSIYCEGNFKKWLNYAVNLSLKKDSVKTIQTNNDTIELENNLENNNEKFFLEQEIKLKNNVTSCKEESIARKWREWKNKIDNFTTLQLQTAVDGEIQRAILTLTSFDCIEDNHGVTDAGYWLLIYLFVLFKPVQALYPKTYAAIIFDLIHINDDENNVIQEQLIDELQPQLKPNNDENNSYKKIYNTFLDEFEDIINNTPQYISNNSTTQDYIDEIKNTCENSDKIDLTNKQTEFIRKKFSDGLCLSLNKIKTNFSGKLPMRAISNEKFLDDFAKIYVRILADLEKKFVESGKQVMQCDFAVITKSIFGLHHETIISNSSPNENNLILSKENTEVIKDIVDDQIVVPAYILWSLMQNKSFYFFKEALDCFFKKYQLCSIMAVTFGDNTLLHYICDYDLELAELVIGYINDVDKPIYSAHKGNTLLHVTCQKLRLDILQHVLKKDCLLNLNITNSANETPLLFLLSYLYNNRYSESIDIKTSLKKCREIINLFIIYKANLNDYGAITVLQKAIDCGFFDIACFVYENGGLLNKLDNSFSKTFKYVWKCFLGYIKSDIGGDVLPYHKGSYQNLYLFLKKLALSGVFFNITQNITQNGNYQENLLSVVFNDINKLIEEKIEETRKYAEKNYRDAEKLFEYVEEQLQTSKPMCDLYDFVITVVNQNSQILLFKDSNLGEPLTVLCKAPFFIGGINKLKNNHYFKIVETIVKFSTANNQDYCNVKYVALIDLLTHIMEITQQGVALVDEIMSNLSQLDKEVFYRECDKDKNNMLHIVCKCFFIINSYLNPNIVNKNIFFLALQQYLDVSTLKKNINNQNIFGQTPLFLAIHYRQLNLVKFFVENGASLVIQDNVGNNSFYFVIRNFAHAIAKILLQSLIDNQVENKVISEYINNQDYQGRTVWHFLSKIGAKNFMEITDLIKQLFNKSHDSLIRLDIQDDDGITPFILACMHDKNDVVAFFIDNYPKIVKDNLLRKFTDKGNILHVIGKSLAYETLSLLIQFCIDNELNKVLQEYWGAENFCKNTPASCLLQNDIPKNTLSIFKGSIMEESSITLFDNLTTTINNAYYKVHCGVVSFEQKINSNDKNLAGDIGEIDWSNLEKRIKNWMLKNAYTHNILAGFITASQNDNTMMFFIFSQRSGNFKKNLFVTKIYGASEKLLEIFEYESAKDNKKIFNIIQSSPTATLLIKYYNKQQLATQNLAENFHWCFCIPAKTNDNQSLRLFSIDPKIKQRFKSFSTFIEYYKKEYGCCIDGPINYVDNVDNDDNLLTEDDPTLLNNVDDSNCLNESEVKPTSIEDGYALKEEKKSRNIMQIIYSQIRFLLEALYPEKNCDINVTIEYLKKIDKNKIINSIEYYFKYFYPKSFKEKNIDFPRDIRQFKISLQNNSLKSSQLFKKNDEDNRPVIDSIFYDMKNKTKLQLKMLKKMSEITGGFGESSLSLIISLINRGSIKILRYIIDNKILNFASKDMAGRNLLICALITQHIQRDKMLKYLISNDDIFKDEELTQSIKDAVIYICKSEYNLLDKFKLLLLIAGNGSGAMTNKSLEENNAVIKIIGGAEQNTNIFTGINRRSNFKQKFLEKFFVQQDANGNTPLHYLCQYNHYQFIAYIYRTIPELFDKLLVETNNAKQDPLDIALKSNSIETCHLILSIAISSIKIAKSNATFFNTFYLNSPSKPYLDLERCEKLLKLLKENDMNTELTKVYVSNSLGLLPLQEIEEYVESIRPEGSCLLQ